MRLTLQVPAKIIRWLNLSQVIKVAIGVALGEILARHL